MQVIHSLAWHAETCDCSNAEWSHATQICTMGHHHPVLNGYHTASLQCTPPKQASHFCWMMVPSCKLVTSNTSSSRYSCPLIFSIIFILVCYSPKWLRSHCRKIVWAHLLNKHFHGVIWFWKVCLVCHVACSKFGFQSFSENGGMICKESRLY